MVEPNPTASGVPPASLAATPADTDADWAVGSALVSTISTRLSASLASKAMLSFLFVLGLLVGIVGAVIAVAGVVIVGVTAAAWLKALVAFLRARSNQPPPANRAAALTRRHG
jgi:hypothetical protein